MSRSAISVLVFGIYIAILGFLLLLVPNWVITPFGIAPAREVWIRLSGIMLMALSVYYLVAVKHNLVVIFKITAYIRFTIIFFIVAFAALKLVSPNIIFFGIIDFLGGLWTYLSLKKEDQL